MYETIKKDLYKFVKTEVVRRFTGLGYKKRSVYRWLDRKVGSRRAAKIVTKLMVAKLRAYFNRKSGQHVFLGECIKKRLELMIKEYYQDGNYVSRPNLASLHYAIMVQNYLYVAKEVNQANVPKARQIEDFWGNLKAKVYEGDWKAKNLNELENKTRTCLSNMDPNVVQDDTKTVRSKLDIMRLHGEGSPLFMIK
ncbi:glucosylceramidase 4 [Brachionus plicatilis]|uniref:Glucosylceramidase 4 n=1 Tax=Brachionus plicatilis TaxID=10195 RepID=A0A3M7Q9B3_BRAPC|nr:glucosylceramidase 4 [Brachionus plicatilis]